MKELFSFDQKVYKTKNYSQFKLFGYNRNINPKHVENLCVSISTHNLLNFVPILVDNEFRVIDGQHRLEAAKKLHQEIYYLILPKATFEDVVLLNANNRKWGSEDYLKMYCEQGYKDYLTLRDFSKQWGFSINLCLRILNPSQFEGGQSRSIGYKAFKEGKFKVGNLEKANSFARILVKFRRYTENNSWKTRAFNRVIQILIDRNLVDDLLVELKKSKVKIQSSGTIREYLRQVEIYLNRSKTKNLIRLF